MKESMGFDYRKAIQAINLLVRKYPELRLNKMKALKLLWAADRYHLRKYGRPIVGDTYVAMGYGPVPSTTKDILEKNSYLQDEVEYSERFLRTKKHELESIREEDLDIFSDTDKEALEFAFATFGNLNQWDLYKLTHLYPEWKKFEDELNSKKSLVELMDYLDFFKDPKIEKDSFQLDEESIKESKSIFEDAIKNRVIWDS
jgi:uncharacterized phage-associated protein